MNGAPRIFRVFLAPLLLVLLTGISLPLHVHAQTGWLGFGSTQWFDWSDYRGVFLARAFFTRLESGSAVDEANDRKLDFMDSELNLSEDPEFFREFIGAVYLDRLGMRVHVEGDSVFRGAGADLNDLRESEFNVSTGRVGVDIDILRTQFYKAGINYDVHTHPILLKHYIPDIQGPPPDVIEQVGVRWQGPQPMTVGIHGRAIPFRLREVPFTIQARARFPVPFVPNDLATSLIEWQVTAGLRPAIWDVSAFGHSTFSASLEAGFKSVAIDFESESYPGNVKAHWQGAIVQFGLIF